ncbi:MAG TPA: isoprenylcysteine carboxylmethyltransferase family protein [Anaerolineales bacterium]|jgi:protein-S-isoprenylcysteine O-methyltransferase Ste14
MIMGTIYIAIASILWGLVHSVLASLAFTRLIRNISGELVFYRLYRFAYNVFALASFFPILLMLITFPDRPLYSIPAPWVYLTTFGQGLAAIALIAGVMQTGLWEFAGLAQLTSISPPSQPAGLVMSGLYAHVRHPLYAAGLLFIWLSPEMTLNRLVVWISMSIYVVIGAYFEERKLLREFGALYADYKARTPMLIPAWRKNT